MKTIITMPVTPGGYVAASDSAEGSVIESYCDGYRQAIRDFAVWRDGTLVVGCSARTLEELTGMVEDDRLNLLDPGHAAGRS